MAGLNLGVSAGYMGPAAALPPSYAGSAEGATISARAYGIAGASGGAQPTLAAHGSVAISLAATAALVWLWWTLPR